MDTLSTVLEAVRVEAGIFSRAHLGEPWAVRSGAVDHGIFHVVVRGEGHLIVDGTHPISWRAGDLLLLPRGAAHVMASDPAVRPRPIGALPNEPGPDGVSCLTAGGEGSETLLLCGSVRLHPAARAFVLGPLDDVLHVRPVLDQTAAWLDTSLRLLTAEQLVHEPGSRALSARLCEMLFVQILREAGRASAPGWLAASFDPQIGAALAALHADPRASWTSDTLARRAGLSRSVFYGRFRETVGEAPGAYLTRWRLVVASMALAEGCSLGEAAARSGYASEASLARAFKRERGVTAGSWRAGAIESPDSPRVASSP